MKGQAFDTFKLMIAAVIAVAILGILLGILGGISLPGADPASIMKEQLSKANQFPGSIFVSATEANFQSGVTYVESSFIVTIGGTGNIEFICGSDFDKVCNSDKGLVSISGSFRAKISACYNNGNAKIGIGVKSADSFSC
jgi:hypothetical protein